MKVMTEGYGDGHLSLRGLSWATWSGFVYQGLWEMAERGSGGGLSHSL